MIHAKRTLAIIALSALAMGCTAQQQFGTPQIDTSIQIATSLPMTPLIEQLSAEYNQIYDTQFVISPRIATHDIAYRWLFESDIQYMMSYHLPSQSGAWSIPIANDGIAMIVHPSIQLNNLNNEQLRAIYRNQISSWESINNQILDIQLASHNIESDIAREFNRLIVGQYALPSRTHILSSDEQMIEFISQTPGAIGYVSWSYWRHQSTNAVKALEIDATTLSNIHIIQDIYPLRLKVYLLGTQEADGNIRDFLLWIQSDVGQAIISQFFIPLIE